MALCHDKRIMLDAPKAVLCFSEMEIRRLLPISFELIMKSAFPIQAAREMIWSAKNTAKEALKLSVVSEICSTDAEIDRSCEKFI